MFVLHSPGEIAFNILGLSVYWYGVVMALAVFAGVLCTNFLAKETEIPRNFFIDNSAFIIIIGLLGARIYYCLLNFGYYLHAPLEILDVRQGGLSIHGMLIVGVLVVYYLAKKHQISFLKIADILACAVPLAQSIGRWGNFFNSEAFGLPVTSGLGLYIDAKYRPSNYETFEYFHPTFLYESILDFILFIVLFFVFKRKIYNSGVVFFAYIMSYSSIRMLIEYLRLDSALDICGIPVAQIVSVILFVVGMTGLFYVNKKSGLNN